MSDLNRLKIKTNVVLRTMKDTDSYSKEVVAQKKKIEDMKAAGADEHDIRQMVSHSLFITHVYLSFSPNYFPFL